MLYGFDLFLSHSGWHCYSFQYSNLTPIPLSPRGLPTEFITLVIKPVIALRIHYFLSEALWRNFNVHKLYMVDKFLSYK